MLTINLTTAPTRLPKQFEVWIRNQTLMCRVVLRIGLNEIRLRLYGKANQRPDQNDWRLSLTFLGN